MPLVDAFEQVVQAHNQEDKEEESDKVSQNANAVGTLGSDDVGRNSQCDPTRAVDYFIVLAARIASRM